MKVKYLHTTVTIFIAALYVVFLFRPIKSFAAANSTINFQGKIVNKSDGTNLNSGSPSCVVSGVSNDTCDFRFSIYSDPSGGTLFWQETHTNLEIGQYDGIFTVQLNSICNSWIAPSGSCTGSGITWGTDDTVYIQVEFDDDGNGDFVSAETFSRKLLTSVPYSYYSDTTASVIGGMDTVYSNDSDKILNINNSAGLKYDINNNSVTGGIGFWLDNNDTTNNPLAFAIDNSSSSSAIRISQTGNTGSTISDALGGALHISNTSNSDYAFSIYSNQSSSTSPLGYIFADNSSFDNELFRFSSDSNAINDSNTAGVSVITSDASGVSLFIQNTNTSACVGKTDANCSTGGQPGAETPGIVTILGQNTTQSMRFNYFAAGTSLNNIVFRIMGDGRARSDVGFTVGSASTNYDDHSILVTDFSTLTSFTLDLQDSSDRWLRLVNTGGGTANFEVSGDIQIDGGNILNSSGAAILTFSGTDIIAAGDIISSGNVNIQGSIITLDEDNTTSDNTVRIIANQGLDNDGEIRYNPVTDRWEVSNDGGIFVPLLSGGSGTGTSTLDDVYTNDPDKVLGVNNSLGLELQSASAGNISIDLQLTGDFVLQDNNSTFLTIDDQGGLDYTLDAADNPNFVINNLGTGVFRINDQSGDLTPFLIDSNGYVGIGDATPAANLVIGSDTTADYANGVGDTYIQNDLEVDGVIYGTLNGFYNPGFTTGSVVFQGASGLTQDNSNFFWNDSTNRLGIGTNNPQYMLDINGGLHTASGTIYLGTKNLTLSNTLTLTGNDASTLAFPTSGGAITYGIPATNISNTFTASQTIARDASTNILNLFTLSNTGANEGETGVGMVFSTGTSNQYKHRIVSIDTAASPANPDFQIQIDNGVGSFSPLLTINSLGYLGLGDISPDQALEVMSTSTANTQLTISNINAGNFNPQVGFELADGTNVFTIGVDDADGDKFKIGTTGLSTNTRFTITSTGAVGIGTTNPTYPLEVIGGNATLITRQMTGDINSPQSAIQIGLDGGTMQAGGGPSYLFFADDSNGNKEFLGRLSAVWENPTDGSEAAGLAWNVRANAGDTLAYTEALRVLSNGNVGIGISSPQHKLVINQSVSTNSANGLQIDYTQTTNAANLTGAGLSISATSSGDAGDTVLGLNINNITSTSSTEQAINIGTGWDRDINFNNTSTTWGFADNTSMTWTDGTNNLLTSSDLSTNFGLALDAGAFMSRNSYIGEEFSRERADLTADGNQTWGDFQGLGVDETSACRFSIVNDTVNGIGRLATASAAGNGCLAYHSSATGNAHLQFDADNLPLMMMKVRPSATSANDDTWVGIGTDVTGTATDPTSGIYFTNNNGTTWTGVTRNASTSTTVECTGVTISTTQYALLKIEVRSTTDVRFYVDNDVSNGVSWTYCGQSTTNIPTVGLGSMMKFYSTSNTRYLDVDYYRVWQDDTIDSSLENTNQSETGSGTIVEEVDDESDESDNSDNIMETSSGTNTIDIMGLQILQSGYEGHLQFTSFTEFLSGIKIVGLSEFDEITVNNSATFKANVEFLSDLQIEGALEIINDIIVKGKVLVGNDTAGEVELEEDDYEVQVIFDKPYKTVPIINVTPEDYIGVFTITDKTEFGFKIMIPSSAESDIKFNWFAVAKSE